MAIYSHMKINNYSRKNGTSLVMVWELTLEDIDIINQDFAME